VTDVTGSHHAGAPGQLGQSASSFCLFLLTITPSGINLWCMTSCQSKNFHHLPLSANLLNFVALVNDNNFNVEGDHIDRKHWIKSHVMIIWRKSGPSSPVCLIVTSFTNCWHDEMLVHCLRQNTSPLHKPSVHGTLL
jgi:hypothetical protein